LRASSGEADSASQPVDRADADERATETRLAIEHHREGRSRSKRLGGGADLPVENVEAIRRDAGRADPGHFDGTVLRRKVCDRRGDRPVSNDQAGRGDGREGAGREGDSACGERERPRARKHAAHAELERKQERAGTPQEIFSRHR
jgi:hypothetical protein